MYKIITFEVNFKNNKDKEYNNNLWEKCLSGLSKVHMAERKILQVRYLTYGWLFYKVHLLPPEHLIGYIKGHLKLWVCLTLQCTILWMVRDLVSLIDSKKELKFWTTLIIVLKYIYSHPKNDNKIGPKYKISSECSLSQNNKKHYCNIFS
jgi:hypothetical protein